MGTGATPVFRVVTEAPAGFVRRGLFLSVCLSAREEGRAALIAGAPITQGKEGGAEGRAGFRENSRRGGCSHLPGSAVSPSKKNFFRGWLHIPPARRLFGPLIGGGVFWKDPGRPAGRGPPLRRVPVGVGVGGCLALSAFPLCALCLFRV